MPRKNSLKVYVKNGYYHVYNRGVEKRNIFEDNRDYKTFLALLKFALSPTPDPKSIQKTFTLQGLPFQGIAHQPKNFHKNMELIAYCLMPNHFHLILHQLDDDSLKSFMTSLITRYSLYFNKRYDRVGGLFQSVYKGILIMDENYLLHLSRYIHLNPSEFTSDLTSAYSSYGDYLGLRNTSWVKPETVLNAFNNKVGVDFKKINNYKDFVEKYKQDDKLVLGNLALE